MGDSDESVTFLIDTGADSTMLGPASAYKLLGDEYLNIDFENDLRRSISMGIGGYALSVARPAQFHLLADDGTMITFQAPIMLAQPISARGASDGNWDVPNLLGRDILRFFELHLDYFPRPELHLWFDPIAAEVELGRLRRWYQYLEGS